MLSKWHTEKVLDHGYVSYVDSMGSDESIVEAARMSTDRGFQSWDPYVRCKKCGTPWRWFKNHPDPSIKGTYSLFPDREEPPGKCCDNVPTETSDMERFPNGDIGLLDTLWRKKHATPFEMGELCIEVQAPIMVFREWHRHRTQSFNEFSARYSVMPNLHYLPEKSRIQKQSMANKQGSAEQMSDETSSQVRAELQREQEEIYSYYEGWCESGIAREVARLNTPVSRYSKMRAKGNLRNWFGFLNLRYRPDAQWEIQMYAHAVAKIIRELWPRAYELFEEYDLYGASFSRSELKALRSFFNTIDARYDGGGMEDAGKLHGLTGTKLKEFITKLSHGGEKILA